MKRSQEHSSVSEQGQGSEEKDGMDNSMSLHSDVNVSKAAMCLMLMGLTALTGCGSVSVKPVVGSIIFTDINGKMQPSLVSLNVNKGTYVMVNLTDDNALLGADWSVSCQSALPPGTPLPPGQTEDLSCGTFTPQHSMSGKIPPPATSGTGYVVLYSAPAAIPKGNTVTLYASATADHSRFSAVTLTITDLP